MTASVRSAVHTRRRALKSLAAAAALPLAGCGTLNSTGMPPAPRAPLRIATAAAGGGFALYGDALAQVLPARAGVPLTLRPTTGTTENLRQLAAGEADLALAVMGIAYDAWRGEAAFAGQSMPTLRAVTPMYETAFHFMARRDRGPASLRELHGRRVGVGPRGGTAEVFMAGLTAATGIAPIGVHGTLAALMQQLTAGEIDAVWFGAGLPIPAFAAAATHADLTAFGLDESLRRALIQRLPFFAESTIAAGTYRGQTEPVAAVAVWNFVLARADADAAQVQGFTQAIFDQRSALAVVYAAAAQSDARGAGANTFLPFHPGALRVYDALGAGAAIAPALRRG
jgi:TRAP transporter TAXI family solute receptor